MASEIRVNKIANRAGLSTVQYTDTGIIVSGIVTCTEISGINALNIAGVSTFASPLDINGDIDVDGHTNLDNLSVAGVSTFSGEICLDTHPTRIKSSAGDLEIGVGTTSSFFITGGPYSAERLETTVDCVILYSAGSKVARTHNGRFEVGNPAAAIGIGATVNITGNANFAGIVTATSFSGSGADLTGIDTDLVSDTSPQLGGDLESNTHNIKMADSSYTANNNKIYCGNFLDFKIYHDGTPYENILQSNGAVPIIIKPKDTDVGLKVLPDSGVELYWDNAKKFETTQTGAVVTGILTATSFSGDGSSLSNLPAGAPVGGASTNTVFFENDTAVAVNYQITSGKNAMSAGPIAINAGIAVTVPSGSSWTIV